MCFFWIRAEPNHHHHLHNFHLERLSQHVQSEFQVFIHTSKFLLPLFALKFCNLVFCFRRMLKWGFISIRHYFFFYVFRLKHIFSSSILANNVVFRGRITTSVTDCKYFFNRRCFFLVGETKIKYLSLCTRLFFIN